MPIKAGLLAVILLLAQTFLSIHELSQHPQDSDDHTVCELCLAANDLGSALGGGVFDSQALPPVFSAIILTGVPYLAVFFTCSPRPRSPPCL